MKRREAGGVTVGVIGRMAPSTAAFLAPARGLLRSASCLFDPVLKVVEVAGVEVFLARLIVYSDVVALRGLSHALRPHSAATLTTHTGTL